MKELKEQLDKVVDKILAYKPDKQKLKEKKSSLKQKAPITSRLDNDNTK